MGRWITHVSLVDSALHQRIETTSLDCVIDARELLDDYVKAVETSRETRTRVGAERGGVGPIGEHCVEHVGADFGVSCLVRKLYGQDVDQAE